MVIVKAVDRFFVHGLAVLCVVLFLVMLASVFGQVVMRYAFSSPLAWSEELARYAMIWQAMLAAALCSRKGAHLTLINAEMVSERYARLARYVALPATCILLAFLFWHGWDLAARAFRQTTPGLGLSMSWFYASIPIGLGLMIVGQLLGAFVERDPMAGETGTSGGPDLRSTKRS